MKEFDFLAPKNLNEALRAVDGKMRNYKLLAGGTGLIPDMRKGNIAPRGVVDLNGIKSLRFVKAEKNKIRIGALATITDLLDSQLIKKRVPLLWEAAHKFGGPLIRNRATVGGNLVNASPAADIAIPLLALRAEVKLRSIRGVRTLALNEFFTGYRRTAIESGEILAEAVLPIPTPEAKQGYCKLGLWNAMAIAVTSVGVVLHMDGETCMEAGIALGAIAPVPLRVEKAELLLKGSKVNLALAERCGKIAAKSTRPIDDIRASARYRRHMCEVLVQRVICKSLGIQVKV